MVKTDEAAGEARNVPSDCVICGPMGRAQPRDDGGVVLAVPLCPAHTQSIAGDSLRKITKRFLREQIE